MARTIGQGISRNFLGNSPDWYKWTIIGFLIANPILMATVGPFVTGWILIGQFIFTLAMALKCYPLPAGGLLAVEAVVIGLTSAEVVYEETLNNFPVIMLLMFMVAGIYFMKDLLQFTFTKILVGIRSKVVLGVLFCFAGAFLSAFLDALTVTAVIITVAYGFYNVYHRYASGKRGAGGHDCRIDSGIEDCHRSDLEEFRAFLRNLMMHGAVGTALGGVTTLVGEPQNLLIGSEMGWSFAHFFIRVAPVSIPVLIVGLLTCMALEKFHLFGYGAQLPENVRRILVEQAATDDSKRTPKDYASLIAQGIVAVILIICLALHLAEVGVIGLMIIILLTAMTGETEEHRIGHAFEEALPFTALLVVFFAVVGVIHSQHLFAPITEVILGLQGKTQLAAYYVANGVLSMISDNVFVATVYVTETKMHFTKELTTILATVPELKMTGAQLMERLTEHHGNPAAVIATLPQAIQVQVTNMMTQFELLAVAINTGTNIPSVATPNGQAAFLFLLTSALAPVIRLSYGQMVKLALPYTFTMSIAGFVATWFFL